MILWPHRIKSTADWSAIDQLELHLESQEDFVMKITFETDNMRGPERFITHMWRETSLHVQKPQRGFASADKSSGAPSSSVLLHYCLPLTHCSCQPTASRCKGDVLLKIAVAVSRSLCLTPKGLRVVWESGISLSWQEEEAFARCSRSESLSLRLFRVHRMCAKPSCNSELQISSSCGFNIQC